MIATKKTVKSLALKPTTTDKRLQSKGLKIKFKDNERLEYYMPEPDFIPKQKLGLMKSKKWPATKTEIRILFRDGDEDIYTKTMVDFKVGIQDKINTAGNTAFKFVRVTDKPDMIISFVQNNQAWSYVGTDCGYIAARGMVTMNLGWHIRYRNNQGGERFGTGCHEMLHALGYIHTLQAPACKNLLIWNKPVVYARFAKLGWDKAKVDAQVFTTHPEDQISDNGCDFHSIMCYSVNPGEANVVVGRNNAFSPIDDAKIKADYGAAGVIAATPISQGKPCTQSSNYPGYPASYAVDGNPDTFQHSGSEKLPWWEVDLGADHKVTRIEIINRKDCCQTRTRKFRVFVTKVPVITYLTPGYVFEFNKIDGLRAGINIENLAATGRYVRIWQDNGVIANHMHFAEVKVYGVKI